MTFQRAARFFPAVLCMCIIYWFSAQPGDEVMLAAQPLFDLAPTIGESTEIPWLKIGHFVGYAALGAALLYAFAPAGRKAAPLALAVTLVYAVMDEYHQTFVPGRHAGALDVLIDVCAAGAVILLVLLVKQILTALRQRAGRARAN